MDGTAPLRLALDETFVYWIEFADLTSGVRPDSLIRRLPKTSPGSPNIESIGTGLDLTASGGDAWWVENQTALTLSHRDPQGKVSVTFQRDAANLASLARNSRYVYLTMFDVNAGEWQLNSISVADGTATLLASQPGNMTEFGEVVADDTYVYWAVTPALDQTGTGEIRRVPVDGGAVEIFETAISIPLRLLNGVDAIYWFGAPMTGLFAPAGNLFRKTKDGGATLAIAAAPSFRDMAVDDRFVYWSEADRALALDPTIKKVPIAGGAPVTFASAASGMVDARSLVADDRDLYWVEAASDNGPAPGAIMRAPTRE